VANRSHGFSPGRAIQAYGLFSCLFGRSEKKKEKSPLLQSFEYDPYKYKEPNEKWKSSDGREINVSRSEKEVIVWDDQGMQTGEAKFRIEDGVLVITSIGTTPNHGTSLGMLMMKIVALHAQEKGLDKVRAWGIRDTTHGGRTGC
jgi:hypothetical protein